ncbi:Hydrogenase nickel incorporation protein HypA, partial [Actinidia chinensis var. chinensis]
DHLHAAQTTNEEGIAIRSRSRRGNGLATRRIRLAARHPSFERLDRQSTSPERNDFQRGGIITRQSVPGQKKVVVRPRTSIVQTNGTDHSIQVCLERDEEIDEEEAVCKFCFDILKEDENILKTECCEKPLLIHEACAANQSRGNNTCDSCGQEFRRFPVTLLRELGSSQRMDTQESNKQSYFSWLIRFWKRGF